jgi:hypothetical protein
MAADRPSGDGGRPGGVPDVLLIGVMAVLLVMPAAVWVATGVGGWFQHGRWPSIGFGDAITAIKGLFFHPGHIALAWPAGDRSQLPSTWVFWTVLAVMVAVVATVVLDVALTIRRRVVRRRASQDAVEAFLQKGN